MHAIDIHLKCYKASSIDLSYPSQCSLFTVLYINDKLVLIILLLLSIRDIPFVDNANHFSFVDKLYSFLFIRIKIEEQVAKKNRFCNRLG